MGFPPTHTCRKSPIRPGAIVAPIYQTSTYVNESWAKNKATTRRERITRTVKPWTHGC